MQDYLRYSKQRGLITSPEYLNRCGSSQVNRVVELSRGLIILHLFCGELLLTAEEATQRWSHWKQHDRRSNHFNFDTQLYQTHTIFFQRYGMWFAVPFIRYRLFPFSTT
jgi:hypothetical protein